MLGAACCSLCLIRELKRACANVLVQMSKMASCTARASASLFNFGERLELIGAATHFAAVVVHPTELGYLCYAVAFKLTCFTHDVLLCHQSTIRCLPYVWRLTRLLGYLYFAMVVRRQCWS